MVHTVLEEESQESKAKKASARNNEGTTVTSWVNISNYFKLFLILICRPYNLLVKHTCIAKAEITHAPEAEIPEYSV